MNDADEPGIDPEARLGALGRRPIDPDVRAAHLARAAAGAPSATGAPGPTRRRFGPVAIGAAAVVGFLAGSAGLAAAGALPDQAQGVAHDVFAVVNVDIPEGRDERRGPCVAEAARLDDHGEKRSAKDECPPGRPARAVDKPDGEPTQPGDAPVRSGDAPDRSGEAPDESGDAPGRSGESPGRRGDTPGRSGDGPGRSTEAPGQVGHADEPCAGTPEWAGPMSQDERDALRDEFSRDDCPDEADAEPGEGNGETEADPPASTPGPPHDVPRPRADPPVSTPGPPADVPEPPADERDPPAEVPDPPAHPPGSVPGPPEDVPDPRAEHPDRPAGPPGSGPRPPDR